MLDLRNFIIKSKDSNKKEIKHFIKKVEELKCSSEIEKAYKATSKAYRAKISLNPLKKMELLREFKEEIDHVISNEKSTEIVFLRFLIQRNVPVGLGFSMNLKEDYDYLKEKISTSQQEEQFDDTFKKFITNFIELNKIA